MPNEKKSGKIWIRSIIVAILCCCVVSILYKKKVFEVLENKTYDSRMIKTAGFISRNDDILFLVIDQDSLDWVKETRGWSWPWPREVYAQIVDFLSEGDVKSIAFDMIYDETSVYGNDDDEIFGEAEKRSGKVIQTIYVSVENGEEKANFPVKAIGENAAIIGNITSAKDSDDVIRCARLYYDYEGIRYPALGIAPLILNDEYRDDIPEESPGIVRLRFQKSTDVYHPFSVKYILQCYDYWKNPDSFDISAEEASELFWSPSDFEGYYVYLGLYAPGLFDICSTPVSQVYPGVGVHITTLDNFLNNSFIRVVPNSVNYLWIFFLAIFGASIVAFSETKVAKTHKIVLLIVLGFLIGCLLSIGLPYILFIPGIWLQLIPALIAFLSSFIISLGFSYTIEGRQKRFIKSAFGQYISPVVVEELIADPDKLVLGGERREISIYFSDLQGFTSISEKMKDPEQLIKVLNKYLTEMSNIIMKAGGTIDKYEGDAIVAFWNAPVSKDNHGKLAIEAAMECQKRLSELRDDFEALCGEKLYQRIGLNTGIAVVGNMGSENRFDYTMLGDSVNLASRLEGLNKQFGTYTMCTEATRQAAIKFNSKLKWRKLANVAVFGKKEPVIVYEPIDTSVYEQNRDIYEEFQAGFNLFYAGKFKLALSVFEKNEEKDPASMKYAEKCRQFIANPPQEWNGVWVATEK